MHYVLLAKEGEIRALESKVESLEAELKTLRKIDPPIEKKEPEGLKTATALVKSDPAYGLRIDPAFKQLDEALVLIQTNQIPEAILGLSKIIDENPNHPLRPHAKLALAQAYLKQKDSESAQEILVELIKKEPYSPVISVVLKELYEIELHRGNLQVANQYRKTLSSFYPFAPATLASAQLSSAIEASKTQSAPENISENLTEKFDAESQPMAMPIHEESVE